MLSHVSLMFRIYSSISVSDISVFNSRFVCAVGNQKWKLEYNIRGK
jgi:hypothetical protein